MSDLLADPDVLARNLRVDVRLRADDDVIALGLNGTYFELDGLAAEIWIRIDGRASLGTIAGEIVTRYGVTIDEVRDDLRDAVAPLLAADFLRRLQ